MAAVWSYVCSLIFRSVELIITLEEALQSMTHIETVLFYVKMIDV